MIKMLIRILAAYIGGTAHTRESIKADLEYCIDNIELFAQRIQIN